MPARYASSFMVMSCYSSSSFRFSLNDLPMECILLQIVSLEVCDTKYEFYKYKLLLNMRVLFYNVGYNYVMKKCKIC